jgi:hypothetical protein
VNEGNALASTLEPALRDACRGHLGPVQWFHATWQHGGAGTGFAQWTTARGRKLPCVVKLPVPYREYAWTKRLGLVHEDDWDRSEPASLPTPRVLAGGFELGTYDFAWLIMERFPGNPVGAHALTEPDIWDLFETTAEFHAAAVLDTPVELTHPGDEPDWIALLDRAERQAEALALEPQARWSAALSRVRDGLPALLDAWKARPIDTWCHRDVHAHNAMRRDHADGARGKLALIDLARIAPGCWVEDALYLERLCWGRDEVLCGVDPVRALAQTRRGIGLPVGDADLALADIRRVLMAATSPAFSRTQGDLVYLGAALERLERLLPAVCG